MSHVCCHRVDATSYLRQIVVASDDVDQIGTIFLPGINSVVKPSLRTV